MAGQSQLSQEIDVWAFAICCTEILTMGRIPWPLHDDDSVRHFVLSSLGPCLLSKPIILTSTLQKTIVVHHYPNIHDLIPKVYKISYGPVGLRNQSNDRHFRNLLKILNSYEGALIRRLWTLLGAQLSMNYQSCRHLPLRTCDPLVYLILSRARTTIYVSAFSFLPSVLAYSFKKRTMFYQKCFIVLNNFQTPQFLWTALIQKIPSQAWI